MSLFLSLPATFALLIASEEIVSALFGYGSFNEESIKNSSTALFYFAIGLPAFSMIKIFSSFVFAQNDTKTPFYFSLISVVINILISISLFSNVGFIIIPIATTISSYINGFLLMVFVINKNYFGFNNNFFVQILKILITNIFCMGIFYILISFFSNLFLFSNNYKFLMIIILVIFTFILYILFSILIKAFKISDIKLKY